MPANAVERKSAAQPAGTAPTRPAPSTSTPRMAERQSPAFQRANPSTLLSGPGTATPQFATKVAAGEIDLSKGALAIPTDLVESTKHGGDLDVKVRLPGLAQGEIKLRRRGNTFSSIRDQGILLNHPALARFSTATPTVLVLHVADDVVTGWVGLGTPGPAKGGPRSLSEAMAKANELLGWAGLSGITLPSFQNTFADGVIDVRAEKLAFTVGGFLSGTGSAVLDNKALSFDGSAKIQIPGGTTGDLQIKKDPTGNLGGKLDMQVNIGSVAGTVTATLTNGFVSVMGSVAYNGDRMSGKVTLVATDEVTAREVTRIKPDSGGDIPIELPGPDKPVKPGKRAFCGWGQLTFRVTDWLAGTATVVVNSKGQATVIGEIAPPKEFILFEQKEWIKRIFKVEIRAGYGIPVVGQVALFANISLDAIAKIGPGKLYNIKLSGVYSTDPGVAKQLSIEGTLNISAFAGLRARAEAGLVVTILAHDIKAGVGLNAIAGVRGYVEATPRIGMRELAPGKRQYYIQGHLEIAAQPVLGFSGDLFVEIETPWWSPLSDKRWTWPLFSLEYPLPGEFGIGADVDYVLGSKQWPKIEFGEVNFDSSKFLTDVMNDNADSGSGGEQKKRGEWQEGLGGGGPGGAKNKGGSGKKPGESGADSEPVGESLAFSDGKESHRLWFQEKPGEAKLMVASKEQTVPERLNELKGDVKYLLKADQSAAELLIGKARTQLATVQDEARQVAAMKEAERKAEETYKKYGKDKGKSKGKKSNRKDKNKTLKTDEKKLEAVLKDLFSLMRMEEWRNVSGHAKMHSGGNERVEIVAQGITAAIHVENGELTTTFARLLGGPVGMATNKAAERLLRQAWNDLKAIGVAVGETRIKKGQVSTRAYQALLKQIAPIAAVVGRIGTPMRVQNLLRARQILPLQPITPVGFEASPATPGDSLYRGRFIAELRRQLTDQQRALNQLPVDRWFANLALFKMNREVYLQLDKSARDTVRQILIKRAEAARERARKTLDRLEKKLDDILAAGVARGFNGDIVSRLWRAKQRKEAAQVAIDELTRAAREDDMPKPELVRPLYSGLREKMDVRIAGRQGAERAARAQHKKNLLKLIAATNEWEGLATETGDLAILHRPDQVAGGYDRFPKLKVPPNDDENSAEWKAYLANLRQFFGLADVNSHIGRAWPERVGATYAKIKSQVATHEAQPINRLNLRLFIEGGGG